MFTSNNGAGSEVVAPAALLFPLGLGTALSLMGDATLYTVLPTHTEQAGISIAAVGMILGVNRAVRLFTNGPAGLAYDRWPRRWLFVPALFLGALSTALCAATWGFWPLFLGRLLWGLAWSGIWVGGATMILDVTVTADRGRWTGLYQTWFFLGTGFGAFAGGVLTDVLGYRGSLWVGALLSMIGAVAALVLLPETRRAQTYGPTTTKRDTVTDTPLRANGALWAAVALQGLNRLVFSGVLAATLALIVGQEMSALSPALGAASLTGILMASRSVFGMAAAPLGGALSDVLRSRWLVVLWSVLAGAVGILLLAWGGLVGILVGVLLTSVASGAIQSLTTTLTGDLVTPRQRGRAIGMLHTSGDLGSAVGPPVAYAILLVLSLRDVYVLCGVLLFVGSLLAARFYASSRTG